MNIPNYHRRRIMRAEIAVDSRFPRRSFRVPDDPPRSPESPAWSARRPDAHIVRYIPPYRARSAGYRPVYPPVSILLHESSFYHLLTGKKFLLFFISRSPVSFSPLFPETAACLRLQTEPQQEKSCCFFTANSLLRPSHFYINII